MTADPPGLDAAIEAAAQALFNLGRTPGIDFWAGSLTDNTRRVYRDKAEAAVRAAAPALRAAALREAAEKFRVRCEATIKAGGHPDWREAVDFLLAEGERADRIGGAT